MIAPMSNDYGLYDIKYLSSVCSFIHNILLYLDKIVTNWVC